MNKKNSKKRTQRKTNTTKKSVTKKNKDNRKNTHTKKYIYNSKVSGGSFLGFGKKGDKKWEIRDKMVDRVRENNNMNIQLYEKIKSLCKLLTRYNVYDKFFPNLDALLNRFIENAESNGRLDFWVKKSKKINDYLNEEFFKENKIPTSFGKNHVSFGCDYKPENKQKIDDYHQEITLLIEEIENKKKMDNTNVIDTSILETFDYYKTFYSYSTEFNDEIKQFLIYLYETLKCKKDTEAREATETRETKEDTIDPNMGYIEIA
jgi:hypothetical protein